MITADPWSNRSVARALNAEEAPRVWTHRARPRRVPANIVRTVIAGKVGGNGLKLTQLYNYLKKMKIMRPEQKGLAELATSKLTNIAKTFDTIKADVAKMPVE